MPSLDTPPDDITANHNAPAIASQQRSVWQRLRGWGVTLLLFAVLYPVLSWWRQPIMPANPNLQLQDYQGQKVNIAALSTDAPVLVYFWGSWCGVCHITSPIINDLSATGAYSVVTVAIKSGDNHTLEQYLKAENLSFTTINDNDGRIFNNWQGQVTPSYVIINDGEMTQGLTGIQPAWSLRVRLWLSDLLHYAFIFNYSRT